MFSFSWNLPSISRFNINISKPECSPANNSHEFPLLLPDSRVACHISRTTSLPNIHKKKLSHPFESLLTDLLPKISMVHVLSTVSLVPKMEDCHIIFRERYLFSASPPDILLYFRSITYIKCHFLQLFSTYLISCISFNLLPSLFSTMAFS